MHPILTTPELIQLKAAFDRAGYQIRVVGGAVRDILLGLEPKDIDLCTDATPDQMVTLAAAESITLIPTGLQHGTVTFVINKEMFEVTTLRIDVDTDGRHAEVEFTTDWRLDAERRDLTINAMSMDFDGTIYDYFQGQEHLSAIGGVQIKFVGDARKRIEEDYLRILRYFRFASRFDAWVPWKMIDLFEETPNLQGLAKISKERVWMEVSKILMGKGRSPAVECMYLSDVHQAIGFPRPHCHIYNVFPKLERADDAISGLSVFCGNVDPEMFGRNWKLSAAEIKKLVWLCAQQKNIAPTTQEQVENYLVDGVPRDYVVSRMLLMGAYELADYAQEYQAPIFPVKGQDLLDTGRYTPGPSISTTLKTMRAVWIDTRFTISKDELLENYA